MDLATLLSRYSKIVICDTEYTTWAGAKERHWSGPNEHRELVQLAAARVDLDFNQVTDTLDLIIRPRINNVLSDYFIDLTGISQSKIDKEGVDFAVAYEKFIDWTGDLPIFWAKETF